MSHIHFRELREGLEYLREHHSLIGIKGGTEVEGNSFEEILEMRELTRHILPLTVKIGGPEARNDISFLLSINTDVILAPMIESEYALRNFVDTAHEMNTNGAALAVNIETITAYENLGKMINLPHFRFLHQVTVGRSDLSGSVEKDTDDDLVYAMTTDIIRMSKACGKKTSVGGKITPVNAGKIQSIIRPDAVNTRHMVVSCSSGQISLDVTEALKWERKLYEYLSKQFPLRNSFYEKRISSIETRCGEKILVGPLSIEPAAIRQAVV